MTFWLNRRDIIYKAKRIIYVSFMFVLKMLWQLKGKRSINAFGEQYFVTYDTIFPTYRKFPLPKGHCLSEIVRFTDFVQLHSICNLLLNRTKPFIIEVGAHHGAYAVILGKIAKKTGGKVIAIEPNPISFKKLNENISLNNLNNVVATENVAISNACGKQSLVLDNSQSRLSNTQIIQGHKSCDVATVTIEYLLQKYSITNVDLLIIDIEGAELLALQSFAWASCKIENVYCELHPYAWHDYGYNAQDFVTFVKQNKIRVFDMYLHEYTTFDKLSYIGPTIFIKKYD